MPLGGGGGGDRTEDYPNVFKNLKKLTQFNNNVVKVYVTSLFLRRVLIRFKNSLVSEV